MKARKIFDDFVFDNSTEYASWDGLIRDANSWEIENQSDQLIDHLDEMGYFTLDGMFDIIKRKAESYFKAKYGQLSLLKLNEIAVSFNQVKFWSELMGGESTVIEAISLKDLDEADIPKIAQERIKREEEAILLAEKTRVEENIKNLPTDFELYKKLKEKFEINDSTGHQED